LAIADGVGDLWVRALPPQSYARRCECGHAFASETTRAARSRAASGLLTSEAAT
jgi:hypothetical protein